MFFLNILAVILFLLKTNLFISDVSFVAAQFHTIFFKDLI